MEVLEQDRIAALVEAAKEGQLPEAEAPSARRGARVRTIDFSRPTKFGADHQRGLNRAIDTFCFIPVLILPPGTSRKSFICSVVNNSSSRVCSTSGGISLSRP